MRAISFNIYAAVVVSLVLLTSCQDGSPLPPSTSTSELGVRGPSGRGDLVRDETLEPQSGETIDCNGGSILPRIRAEDNGGVSVPDTLIFLGPGVHGVKIRNCTLEATFPIVALGG